MATAGPLSTITIAVLSFIGIIIGGILSDRWVQRNVRRRDAWVDRRTLEDDPLRVDILNG